MELRAKELRRSRSADTKNNWIRHIKLIIQRKISIYSMEVYYVGENISDSKTKAFISHAFIACSMLVSLTMLTCPRFRHWISQCHCPGLHTEITLKIVKTKPVVLLSKESADFSDCWLPKKIKPITEWEQAPDKDSLKKNPEHRRTVDGVWCRPQKRCHREWSIYGQDTGRGYNAAHRDIRTIRSLSEKNKRTETEENVSLLKLPNRGYF